MKLDVIQVNDWVYSDSPGIWKVFRVLQGIQRMRFNLQERKRIDKRRLIFSKRLVDKSWKPAFTSEMANAEFVHPLSEEDRRRLEEFIAKNPQILREFDLLQPKEVDSAMDLRLNVPGPTGMDGIQHLVKDAFAGIEMGLTNEQILQRLGSNSLANYVTVMSGNATLRFLSKNHELRNNEYIFRKVQLIL